MKDKPEIEKRWGWLASLIAGTIVSGFRIFEAYLKTCFSMLESGPQGFFFLIAIHLFLVLMIIL